jgi:hypothetical protein
LLLRYSSKKGAKYVDESLSRRKNDVNLLKYKLISVFKDLSASGKINMMRAAYERQI